MIENRVIEQIKNGNPNIIERINENELSELIIKTAIENGYILSKKIDNITNNSKYMDLFIDSKQFMQTLFFFDKELFNEEKVIKLINNNYKISQSTPEWFRNNIKFIKIFIQNGQTSALNYMDEQYKEQILKEKIKTDKTSQTVIEYLINNGYKLTADSPYSIKNNKVYIELLVRKGNYQAINYAEKEGLTEKIIELAIEKGYKISLITSFYIRGNPNYIKLFLNNNQKETLNYITDKAINNEIILLALEKKFYKIIDIINNNPNLMNLYTEEIYEKSRLYLSNKYNLNIEKLDRYVNVFGPISIFYLENDNIKDAIKLSMEELEKYIELFNKNITIKDIKNIIYTLVLHNYYLKNPSVIEIPKIIENIINNSLPFTIEIKNILKKYMKKDYDNIINLIEQANINKQNCLKEIKEIISKKLELDKIEYIKTKQRNLENLNYEINNTEKKYKEILDEIIKKYPNKLMDNDLIKILSEKSNQEYINVLEQIKFIIKPEKTNNDELTSKIKRIKKELIELIKHDYFKELDIYNNLNLMTETKETLETIKLKILSDVNTNNLKNQILNKKENYEKLLKTMNKYKYICWGNIFSNIGKEIDISCDEKAIINLINNYHKVMKKETLIEQLKEAENYNSTSDIYTYMLGEENSLLIKNNHGSYKGVKSKRERLEKTMLYSLKCFERKYITIPPLNEVITINNKEILINLGEISDPINLSSAEKLDLCSRIGGLGQEIFDFCLTNINGGILKFINPINNKIINRILIFREENNVYFNFLDITKNTAYTDEEIIKLTKLSAEMIMKKSIMSDYPINNIYISKEGALRKTNYPLVSLEKSPRLNCDIKKEAILLISNNYERKTNELPKYKLLRNVFLSNEEQISRLKVIDAYTKIREYKDILVEEEKIIYSEVGKDWYVYLNEDNELKQLIINPNLENITEYRSAIKNVLQKQDEIESLIKKKKHINKC